MSGCQAVLGALVRAPGSLSAQAIHARLYAADDGIALSTAYRVLRVLTQAGHVEILHHDGDRQLFHAVRDSGRGHYLVCRHCDRHIPIEAGAAERWACATAAEYGYSEIRAIVELSGICPACAEAAVPVSTRTGPGEPGSVRRSRR